MPGDLDLAYVLARCVLLDALEALGPHRESCILVGAQAVYVHTGPADIAVQEYTTDADLALDPRKLQSSPLLAEALRAAGFRQSAHPGTWLGSGDVEVDLLVPDTLGGGGRRGARLPPHGNTVARKAKGLEAALVDHVQVGLCSLEPANDRRTHLVRVAGPGALVVAKLHKISDRAGNAGRSQDKDALDVLRLLRAVPTAVLVSKLQDLVADALSRDATRQAIDVLDQLFGSTGAVGAEMAARAVGVLDDPGTIRLSCQALARDVLEALGRARI